MLLETGLNSAKRLTLVKGGTTQSLVRHIHCAPDSAIVASALTRLVWVFDGIA